MEFIFKAPPTSPNFIMQEITRIAESLKLNTKCEGWRLLMTEWVNENPTVQYTIKPLTFELVGCLTYHNWQHMAHVVNVAMQLAEYLGLGLEEKLALFFAAMFHDYKHSFGKLKDETNIRIAIMHLAMLHDGKYATIFSDDFFNSNEPYYIIREAVEIMKVTEYPFIHTPSNICEKIIRDADLSMVLSYNAKFFAEGLAFDMNLPHASVTKDSMLDFLKDQVIFIPEMETIFKYARDNPTVSFETITVKDGAVIDDTRYID